MSAVVGQEAPDFELPSTTGDPVRLSSCQAREKARYDEALAKIS